MLTQYLCKVKVDDILSGGNKVVTMEQLSRDLCYNKEMNSNLSYCHEHYKNTYPYTPRVAYYDRGALPIYWYLPYQILLTIFLLTSITITLIINPIYLCI